MTPKEFHQELVKLPHVSDELLAGAREWRQKYPFFQALPVIIAIGEKQRQDQHAAESLHTAAAYAADRSLLKELMSAQASPISLTDAVSADVSAATQPAEPPAIDNAETSAVQHQEVPAAGSATLASPEKPEEKSESGSEIVEVQNQAITDTQTAEVESSLEQATAPGEFADRVMEGLGELRERMNRFNSQDYAPAEPTEQPKQKTIQPKTGAEPKTAGNDPSDKLLDEIKSKKKRQKPETSRQVEQMELIDKFISNKPGRRPSKKTVAEKPAAPAPPPEPPPSAGQDSYSENVISETLVDLLIRQGKREKAIEVLRKLIWKFPQKKALFAARIQELSQ